MHVHTYVCTYAKSKSSFAAVSGHTIFTYIHTVCIILCAQMQQRVKLGIEAKIGTCLRKANSAIFVLPLLYASPIVVACWLWKHQEGRSCQCWSISPSLKMRSLQRAKLLQHKFTDFEKARIVLAICDINDAHTKCIHRRIGYMIALDSQPFYLYIYWYVYPAGICMQYWKLDNW